MKRYLTALFACALVLFAGAPAWAHHSFAATYNLKAPITVIGKIVRVRLSNPHSWFYLDVVGKDGKVQHWSFEAGTPSGMIRNGYSPKVIKQGDRVTISGFHARDPSAYSGMLTKLVTADGKVYGMFGPRHGGVRAKAPDSK